jgi:glycosyltransferase involved in cell wall biosynthesis
MESSTDKFLVMFWGGFIPLQGVKYIVEAAKLLEHQSDITFELRGFGQTYNESIELSRKLNSQNITFIPKSVTYEELPKCIAKASVCLGVFGETQKAKRVIPNKAVETLAMKKPLVTGDSPAAREILKNETDCILVSMANPKAIADAVLELKEDKRLRDKIAQNGFMLFKKKFSPKVIGNDLKMILKELTENSYSLNKVI